jgi:predicted Zn-dependent peptidase
VHTEQLDEGLFRTVAANGLVVLSEFLPSVRSLAAGVWVRSASAHEPREQMGVSHLLEHLVFKGTERRTAHELALALEERGGSLDAWTGRDATSFQAHVLDEDLPLAVEVLTDLVRRPLLRAADLELERQVVLEEIGGVQDTPDDLVFELHAQALWPTHPLGYSILGTPETVRALDIDQLRARHAEAYYPGNCVVAAAGNVQHGRLLELLEADGWFEGSRRPAMPSVEPRAAVRGLRVDEVRDTTQAHVVLGTDTFRLRDPRRHALTILVNALGGGMSSRLFQKVREELGLAYAVYAFRHFYHSTGQFGVYVGAQPGSADAALAAIFGELDRVASEGLPATELESGRRQLKGQVVLSLESPTARMGRLAGTALHGEPFRPLGRVLDDIDAVTSDLAAAVAAEFLAPARQTVQWLGPRAA